MRCFAVSFALFGVLAFGGCGQTCLADDETTRDGTTATAETDADAPPEKVIKSDAEWQRILTRSQFYVTRMKGTEPPFSGAYVNYHGKGTFACVGCGTTLFDARTKFNSGTGWPSFYAPVNPQRIATAQDFSMYEPRVEVMCATCGAHLGHVFDDGPRPTGLRFCINSVALKLQKPVAAPKSKAKTKTKTTTPPKAKDSAGTEDSAKSGSE